MKQYAILINTTTSTPAWEISELNKLLDKGWSVQSVTASETGAFLIIVWLDKPSTTALS